MRDYDAYRYQKRGLSSSSGCPSVGGMLTWRGSSDLVRRGTDLEADIEIFISLTQILRGFAAKSWWSSSEE